MANISGVIGLGLAKPKEYENVAMQQLAQANAARKEKAKYDKDIADQWAKDVVLTPAMTKGMLPVQVSAASNMANKLMQDLLDNKNQNPNNFLSGSIELKNDFMRDIAIMQERGERLKEVFGRDDLTPRQEKAIAEFQNLGYGTDYDAFINRFQQPASGNVYPEPISGGLVVPHIPTSENVIKGIQANLAAQKGEKIQKFGKVPIPGDPDYNAFTTTLSSTPEEIEAVAKVRWAGDELWFKDKLEDEGRAVDKMTDEEIFSEYKDFVGGFAEVKQTATIKGKPTGQSTFDFGAGDPEAEYKKFGITTTPIKLTMGAFGATDNRTPVNAISKASVRFKTSETTLSKGDGLWTTKEGKVLPPTTNAIEFKGDEVHILPVWKENINRASIKYGGKIDAAQVEDPRGQVVDEDMVEGNENLIEYKLIVPGIADYQEGTTPRKADVYMDFDKIGESFYIDIAAKYERAEIDGKFQGLRHKRDELNKKLHADYIRTLKEKQGGLPKKTTTGKKSGISW